MNSIIKLITRFIVFILFQSGRGFIFLANIFSQKYPSEIHFKVIATSDLHGYLFPFDLISNSPLMVSLAQINNYVKEQRKRKDQELILLDNGDILQGQPELYYYNYVKTDTKHICSKIMNYMKYDAATIGNHDIEPGHETYDKINREFNFPWLAANALRTDNNNTYFKPYHLIIKKGVKIAILGLITPAVPHWLPEKIYQGIYFEDMVTASSRWVEYIRLVEKPDILIGLFHSGIDYTYNELHKDSDKNENASLVIASKVPGFDVIIAGHDHKVYNSFVKNIHQKDVLVLDPKCNAIYIAEADIFLKYDKKKKFLIKHIKGEIKPTDKYEVDEEFIHKFSDCFNEVKIFVDRPLAKFSEQISSRDSLFGPSEFVDLIHHVQLETTKADISFSTPLSFDATIHQGDFYIRDLFNLYRYENSLYTMEMSGLEIKNCLEYSYGLWFNLMKSENDHLLNFKYGLNILSEEKSDLGSFSYQLTSPFFNFTSAAGIDYTVDISKNKGNRINILFFTNGKPFNLDVKYSVVLNSYQGNGGGGHLIIGAGIPEKDLSKRIMALTEKDIRYYLMNWIEKQKIVTPLKYNNWRVIPENLYQLGKQKDYDLLFHSKFMEMNRK